MKRAKKILSVLLICMVSMMAFPAVTYGATRVASQDGNWEILADYNKNTCTVIAYNGSQANLVIPSKIDGLKVTALEMGYQIGNPSGSRWENRRAIVTVKVPSTVKSIGYATFANLPNLKSVDIPTSVTTFGTDLFNSCTSLTDFTIPSKMTEIPSAMFRYCSALSNVVIHSKVTSIDSSAFEGCTSLKSIKLPSSLEYIGEAAFCESGLQSISIPNSVTEMGLVVFGLCEDLASVKLSTGTDVIPTKTFYHCTSLKTITIPANYTEIEGGTFEGCTSLTTVVCRSNLKLNYSMQAAANLTVYAPSSATKIKEYCSKQGIRWKSLNPPTWSSKKRTTTTAALKWKSVSGATGYKVYKKIGTGSYKLVKTTTSTSYKATGLKKGTTYRFYVTTLKKDALGNTIESKGSTVYKTYLKK